MVFDESFVQAAHLEEFSARERMSDHARAVRHRSGPRGGSATVRPSIVLLILVTLAFGTAVYLGMNNPYRAPRSLPAEPMQNTVLSLAPPGEVPGGRPEELFENSPAASFGTGADGITLPPGRRTEHFARQQVLAALAAAKEYLVQSSLDPQVLTGGAHRSVRLLLDPGQYRQFDRSLEQPAADGRHAATGWMVRFDGEKVMLADPQVRVAGTVEISEVNSDVLEVSADHVFVYAVRAADAARAGGSGAGSGDGGGDGDAEGAAESGTADGAALFTVRREVRMHLDRDDLRERRLELRSVAMQAGPLACGADPAGVLRPLLPGEEPSAEAGRRPGTDPYAESRAAAPLCGTLHRRAMPMPPESRDR